MNKWFFLAGFFIISINLNAQKYYTKDGNISFYSEAPLENIEAHNTKATAVLDLATGDLQWAILIKAFQFEKALMQDHFNENYMESSKFPKATFSGKLIDFSNLDISKEEILELQVSGSLTIHGVTKTINIPVTLEIKDGIINSETRFSVIVDDYNIEIPGIVRNKIAKEVDIHVEAKLIPLATKS